MRPGKTVHQAEAARGQLAYAKSVTKVIERRAVWAPRPALLDALLEGAIITPVMFAVIHYPSRLSNWLLLAACAATVPSVWLRVRIGMRSGVLMRSAKRQIPWTMAYWAGVAAAIIAGKELGWVWAPWVMAVILMTAHYCLRRGGRLV